jgi:hypothetical protein
MFFGFVHLNPVTGEVQIEGGLEFVGVSGDFGFAHLFKGVPEKTGVCRGKTEGLGLKHRAPRNQVDEGTVGAVAVDDEDLFEAVDPVGRMTSF